MEAKAVLKEWIKKKGFTKYNQLADYLGVSVSAMDKWKTRNSIPNEYYVKMDNIDKSIDIVTIMHYKDIKASAGYGVENSELEAIPVETTKDFLKNFFKLTNYNNLEIITVYGDSMLPFLQDGETILIQRTAEVRNNQIIIIRVENDIYVKRYIKEPFSSTIKLVSENKNYDDITITNEQFENIQIIGVVCGSFRLR